MDDVKDLKSIAEHLPLLAGILKGSMAEGQLTDVEEAALQVARRALDLAEGLVPLTGESTVTSIMGVLSAIPFETLAQLVVSWRKVIIRAAELGVTIGPLGPGVRITKG